MTRAAVVTSILLSASIPCFCELIDPPPLKVAHVCGITIAADSELRLTPTKGRKSFSAKSDQNGKFDFVGLPAGLYVLSVKWKLPDGTSFNPIQNRYPLKVTRSTKQAACTKPLVVEELSGTESGLSVRFKGENE